MPVKTLTTDRLVLRPQRPDDAPAIFERWATDAEVTHYLTWAPHRSVDDTAKFLATSKNESRWCLCVKEDKAPIGMITAFHHGHYKTLGYVLARSFWGRGLMSEATRSLALSLWENPATWRIDAHTHVENVGSQRVLEKAGFQREGVLRRAFKIARCGDTPQDAVMYSQVRDDLE